MRPKLPDSLDWIKEPEPVPVAVPVPPEKPHIKIYEDASVEIIGKHNPSDFAALIYFMVNGELLLPISEATAKSGVDAVWAHEYKIAMGMLVQRGIEIKQQAIARKYPVVSSLQAFRQK